MNILRIILLALIVSAVLVYGERRRGKAKSRAKPKIRAIVRAKSRGNGKVRARALIRAQKKSKAHRRGTVKHIVEFKGTFHLQFSVSFLE